jgi:hypothetical protein
VLIECALGFRFLRGIEFARAFGLTVGEATGLGTRIVSLAFGALAGNSQVDQFSHVCPAVLGYQKPAYPSIACEYDAKTVRRTFFGVYAAIAALF